MAFRIFRELRATKMGKIKQASHKKGIRRARTTAAVKPQLPETATDRGAVSSPDKGETLEPLSNNPKDKGLYVVTAYKEMVSGTR
jgi:hypothetical protein